MQGTTKHIFKLRISLSGICNYKCIFCHNEGKEGFASRFMAKEDVLRLCEGAYRAGIRSITFTGGEPLTHPEAFSIIEEVRSRYPDATLKLTTNGVLLKEKNLSFIGNHIDKIRLNFQSTDSASFKEIVGVDRLDAVLTIIRGLQKTRTHICLNFVYHARSKKLLPSIVAFASNENLELKVLEMIKFPDNVQFYWPIESAKAYLESIAVRHEVDYQEDDVYYASANGPRIRLCYSHCNTLNGKACRLLGELRVSPWMDVYHCMHADGQLVRLTTTATADAIAEKFLRMDEIKGTCPRDTNNVKAYQIQHLGR